MKRTPDKLGKSLFYKSFKKTLYDQFGTKIAQKIWADANTKLLELEHTYPHITGDNKMMILPAAALYRALYQHTPEQALPLLKEHGAKLGNKIARIIHTITSVPGISPLLWKHAASLMRKMSSSKNGYTRRIVSETTELVGVDILSCPLYDAAVEIGIPTAAQVVCAMDKAYMTGFKYIRYTRNSSVAECDECCDYRLSYDKNKL